MKVQQKQTDDVLKSLTKAALEKAQQVIGDIRKRVHGLSPLTLHRLGLVRELNPLIDDIRQRAGIKIEFFHYDLPQQLTKEKRLAIYRIVQEALNNVTKHAKAKQVFVNLMRKDDAVLLSIEDDGIGFEQDSEIDCLEEKNNLGLLIMRERTILLGGEFTIESQTGGGTRILAEIPLSAGIQDLSFRIDDSLSRRFPAEGY